MSPYSFMQHYLNKDLIKIIGYGPTNPRKIAKSLRKLHQLRSHIFWAPDRRARLIFDSCLFTCSEKKLTENLKFNFLTQNEWLGPTLRRI